MLPFCVFSCRNTLFTGKNRQRKGSLFVESSQTGCGILTTPVQGAENMPKGQIDGVGIAVL
jgi:hypothetical protein